MFFVLYKIILGIYYYYLPYIYIYNIYVYYVIQLKKIRFFQTPQICLT